MIERFWAEKSASLPKDILERLEFAQALPHDRSLRCFLSGFGWESFLADLTKYLNCLSSKIFISPPDTQTSPVIENEIKTAWGNNLLILPARSAGTDGASNFEAQLSAFPENTFDLIIFLWLLSPTQPGEMLKRVRKALKPKAQFALVTPFDDSPRLVFSILKQVLKQSTSTKLKLYPSNLPAHTRQLRKLLDRAGFKEVRLWQDTIKCDYPDGQSVFDDLLKLSLSSLFQEPVKVEHKRFIQKKFIEVIEKRRCLSEPSVITVNFDFGCATGFK